MKKRKNQLNQLYIFLWVVLINYFFLSFLKLNGKWINFLRNILKWHKEFNWDLFNNYEGYDIRFFFLESVFFIYIS